MYQEHEFHTDRFMVCQLHFSNEDLITKNGKAMLKREAVPRIFIPPQFYDSSLIQPRQVSENFNQNELNADNLSCSIKQCQNGYEIINRHANFFR